MTKHCKAALSHQHSLTGHAPIPDVRRHHPQQCLAKRSPEAGPSHHNASKGINWQLHAACSNWFEIHSPLSRYDLNAWSLAFLCGDRSLFALSDQFRPTSNQILGTRSKAPKAVQTPPPNRRLAKLKLSLIQSSDRSPH